MPDLLRKVGIPLTGRHLACQAVFEPTGNPDPEEHGEHKNRKSKTRGYFHFSILKGARTSGARVRGPAATQISRIEQEVVFLYPLRTETFAKLFSIITF